MRYKFEGGEQRILWKNTLKKEFENRLVGLAEICRYS